MPSPREPKTFKAGLIGAGYICEYHVAALRRAGVALVGVCDTDAARASVAAKRFGTRAFESPAALAAAGANVLHVLTPPESHAEVALAVLDLGCHVLVEKPLATEPDDCRRIAARAGECGRGVCVNHSLLFDPQVRRALETIRRGKLGRVVSVDLLRSSAYPPYAGGPRPPQYRSAGYPFRDLGVHALYLFEAFLGPIEDVDAKWASLGGDPNLAFDEWRALVRCRDGMGQFHLSWNVRPLQSQIIIQGTKGVLRCDLFLMFQALRAATPLPKPVERLVNATTDSTRPMVDVPLNVLRFVRKKIVPYHGLQELVAAFYRSLRDDGPMPAGADDAVRVVEWTERVARQADAEHVRRLSTITTSAHVPVLVTGASGTIGGAVVDRLLAEGRRVRVLVRRLPDVVPDGVEVAIGDLGDPAAVDRAVAGADGVIHVGAAMRGGWVEHRCGTVVGTQNVLDACGRHRVSKFVHISSMSVIEWAGAGVGAVADEASPLERRAEDRGAYTRAKLEAEKLVTRFHQLHGLPTVILRPGQVFGGKIPLLTAAVARRVAGRWLVLGDGTVRLPLVYLDDLVDAIIQALDGPIGDGRVLQIVDPAVYTQNDVLRTAVGERANVIRLPRAVVFALGRLSEWALLPLGRPSPLSAYRLRSALARRTFSADRARVDLGWTPRVGVAAGMRREIGKAEVPLSEPTAAAASGAVAPS